MSHCIKKAFVVLGFFFAAYSQKKQIIGLQYLVTGCISEVFILRQFLVCRSFFAASPAAEAVFGLI
jgi:hypothetical protein